MIAPLAKLLDWLAIQLVWGRRTRSLLKLEANPRLEEAVQFLNGPDFIPAESQPAQLDFIPDASGGRFRFPTPRPCEFAENNVVHGRLYRCADAWQKRPAVVLLHGGGDIPGHQFGFHLFARRCQRAGYLGIALPLSTPSTRAWSIEHPRPVYFVDQPGLLGDGKDLCAGGGRNPQSEWVVVGGECWWEFRSAVIWQE